MASEQAPVIATHARNCVGSFMKLSSLFQGPIRQPQCGISDSMICDGLGRYKIWAGNIGALHEAQSQTSLDYRLRTQPKIADQVVELLEDLEESLDEGRLHDPYMRVNLLITSSACLIASGERHNRTGSNLNLNEHDKPTDSASTHEGTPSINEYQSEAQELFDTIAETISSLFRISMIIRNATPRDRYQKASTTLKELFDDRYDIDHVGHKFPRLASVEKEWLKRRLGKAVTQRRHYLRYCREHRERLSREPKHELTNHDRVNSEGHAKSRDLANAKSRPDTKAYTVGTGLTRSVAPTTASTLVAANLEPAAEASNESQSQTSYATSIIEDNVNTKLRVPNLDDVTKGVYPFECPYCFGIQDIRRERSWRKHVLHDLKPYVCTFEECDLKMFADRHAWFNHELQIHRVEWSCHLCIHAPIKTLERFESHMQSRHSGAFPEAQLPALAKVSQQSVSHINPSDCPFCDQWATMLSESKSPTSQNERLVVTPAQFRHHVGAHMEQLALFAIPRELNDDEDANSSGAAVAVGTDTSSDKKWETNSGAPYEKDKNPPLHVAAYEGLEAEVAHLLEEGVDINSYGESWGTALLAAIAGGNEPVVRLLLEAGAKPYLRNRDSKTALEVAAQKGQTLSLRLILEHLDFPIGANAQLDDLAADASDYRSALVAAASQGHASTVQLLLEKGAEFNVRATDYQMASQAAASQGHERLERLLFDKSDDMIELDIGRMKTPGADTGVFRGLTGDGRIQRAEIQPFDTLIESTARSYMDDENQTPDDGTDYKYITKMKHRLLRRIAEGCRDTAKQSQVKTFGSLVPDHPSTLVDMGKLAWIYTEEEDWARAAELQSRVVEVSSEFLGPEHPTTLSSISFSGEIFQRQGKYIEAENLYRMVLKMRKKVLGIEHPDTLSTMHLLAKTADSQGKYNEAEELQRELLYVRKKVLGGEHPDTFAAMFQLAMTLLQVGEYYEAECLLRDNLKTKRKVLGMDHQETLTTTAALAKLLQSRGRYHEAEKLNIQLLKMRERLLGQEDHSTLMTLRNLAYLYHVQGRHEKASLFYQKAVDGFTKTLGAEHPTTLDCSHEYTDMLRRREETVRGTSPTPDELAFGKPPGS